MGSVSFCLVTTFYPPASFGGDAVHVRRLARCLARRGHRVRVVHNPTAYRMLGGRAADPPTADPGVEVVPGPAGVLGTAATYLTGLPVAQRGELARLTSGFDVVHFHNPSLLGGPGGLSVGDALRLYTTHEHWLLCPTHVLFRFEREVCEQRTCFRCTLSYHRPPQLWRSTRLMERSVSGLDVLLCPSRFTAALHRAEFPEARIEVLPLPGPEPGEDPTDGDEPDPARPFFLYAGRLEAIKGVDSLIRAFAGLEGADLLIAGDGSLSAELRELAAGQPHVRFLGRVQHGRLLALCRRARAVVVPSVGYETFGGVAVEAMANGSPVVVRRLGPLPELVEDGGGLTFDGDDDLTRVLQRLVDDPGEANRLGSAARQVAADRFGEARFMARYFEIIASFAFERGLGSLADRAEAASRAEAS
ncbi:MAG: glycosyltransferase family 4 protein [Actinomycetota bacterium]|nr:glycosyltransferase family 4 protein [Actinomycetota bacterium]